MVQVCKWTPRWSAKSQILPFFQLLSLPTTPGGYRDQARPVAPQHEGKAPWKQVREELVPAEVREEVKRLARPTGGGVVIEMQWGSSAYLPAHNGGLKYREPLGFGFG